MTVFPDFQTKCIQYWPSSGRVTFGDIDVELVEETQESDYAIRKIRITKVRNDQMTKY